MSCRSVFAFGLGMVLLPAMGQAAEWPQFRGPNGDSLSDEKQLPAEWAKDKNILWKVRLPGVAWSSPVVWGDRVFVTTAVSDKQSKPRPGFGFGGMGGFDRGGRGLDRPFRQPGGFGGGGYGFMGGGKPPDAVYSWEVCCLDRASGKVLWKQVAVKKQPSIPKQASNTYASETPVTDGERVYAYFGMTGVFCYDRAGKQLWKKDLGSYKMMFGHGTGASPTVDGDRLFIQCDNEESSFLVALDKKTGKELWRVRRSEKTSWSTPLVWRNKARVELVACGGRGLRSYDPATGKHLWEMAGLYGQFQASPVADDTMLYAGCGGPFSSRPLCAIRAGASGDLTLKKGETSNAGVAWYRTLAGPSVASPLLYEGYLYIVEQFGGILSCYEAKTGKSAYAKQRLRSARGFTSSPWAYDGKVFCLDEEGRTFVVQAGPKFKLLGENKLDEMFWSSPAVAGGALFLRGVDHLYCIRP